MSAITSSLSTSTISFSVHPGFTSYGRYGRTAPLGVRGGVGLHTGDSNPPPFIQPPSCGRHHSQVSCMISAFCVGSTRAAQFGRLLRFRAWCGTAPVRVTLGRGAPTRLPRASGSHSSGQRHYVVDCYSDWWTLTRSRTARGQDEVKNCTHTSGTAYTRGTYLLESTHKKL